MHRQSSGVDKVIPITEKSAFWYKQLQEKMKYQGFAPRALVMAVTKWLRYKRVGREVEIIPFSAFWLRSSLVSVLDLLSDTRLMEPRDVNHILVGVRIPPVSCCPDPCA